MRHTKTVKIEITDYLACDLCGVTLENDPVTIRSTENPVIITTEIDCCITCWDLNVLPVLTDLGIKPRTHKEEM